MYVTSDFYGRMYGLSLAVRQAQRDLEAQPAPQQQGAGAVASFGLPSWEDLYSCLDKVRSDAGTLRRYCAPLARRTGSASRPRRACFCDGPFCLAGVYSVPVAAKLAPRVCARVPPWQVTEGLLLTCVWGPAEQLLSPPMLRRLHQFAALGPRPPAPDAAALNDPDAALALLLELSLLAALDKVRALASGLGMVAVHEVKSRRFPLC